MKKTMKLALVVLALLAVMGFMILMSMGIGSVLTPVFGVGVASIILSIAHVGSECALLVRSD